MGIGRPALRHGRSQAPGAPVAEWRYGSVSSTAGQHREGYAPCDRVDASLISLDADEFGTKEPIEVIRCR